MALDQKGTRAARAPAPGNGEGRSEAFGVINSITLAVAHLLGLLASTRDKHRPRRFHEISDVEIVQKHLIFFHAQQVLFEIQLDGPRAVVHRNERGTAVFALCDSRASAKRRDKSC